MTFDTDRGNVHSLSYRFSWNKMMSRKRLMTSANNFERFASQNFATSRNDVIFFVTCEPSRNDAVITRNCQLSSFVLLQQVYFLIFHQTLHHTQCDMEFFCIQAVRDLQVLVL